MNISHRVFFRVREEEEEFVCVSRYLEHFQQSFLLYLQPLKRLLLLDDLLAEGLQTGEVIARYAPVRHIRAKHKGNDIQGRAYLVPHQYAHCVISLTGRR